MHRDEASHPHQGHSPLFRERLRAVTCRGAARRVLALIVAAVLTLAAPRSAIAQKLQFRHLRPDDGLPGAWVRAIGQDDRGFMWFGTSTGLARYDGYTMQTYRKEAGDSTSLPHNIINAMRIDRRGTLWIGTSEGLSRYDRAHDNFRTFSLTHVRQGEVGPTVTSILDDVRGRLWVGTDSGLYVLNRESGMAKRFELPRNPAGGPQFVQTLFEDHRHHVIIGTYLDGLFDLDPDAGTLRHFGQRRAGVLPLDAKHIEGIAEDRAGVLWLATYDAGLVRFDPATGASTVFRHVAGDATTIATDRLLSVVVDPSGMLWLGTENAGVDRFDPVTSRFRHARSDPDDPSGLSGDSYWSLYYDARGTLWAGTFSNGIDVLRSTSDGIERFSATARDVTSLGNNSVIGFAEDTTGTVWIATDGGGLNRFDPVTRKFRRYTTANSNLNRDAVQAVTVDHRGHVWLGTWEGGVSELDPSTGRFTAYTTHNSNILDDHIFAVLADSRHRMWVGTWENGFARFDPETKRFTPYHFDQHGRESQVWLITELHDGRLMLGTFFSGLILFDPETGSVTRYQPGADSAHAIAATDVRAILEESPGVVLIGTSGGIDRLNLRTNAITHFTVKDGLPSNMISGLGFDRAGRLWASTDNGIAQVDLQRKQSWAFTVEDGLQAREFTARSYLGGQHGELYFGGSRGFNLIRPDKLTKNSRKPRIAFTKFEVFNQPVSIGGPGSPLSSQISETHSITLDHSHSVFTITFAALDYLAPGKNRYAYKLDGFDRNWISAGTNRSATYTNLAPGTYTFLVRASNNDGLWNDEGVALQIVITPPVWATWWFRTLMVLVVLGVVLQAIRIQQRRHRHLRLMNEQLGNANEELGRAAEHDRESQQYLERNVLDILGAMQRFSSGDYGVSLPVQSEDAIGKLRQGFNAVVADRKRAEEELRQKQKMEAVGRLAGGVAHDFNNLLTVIKGNAALALAEISADRLETDSLEIVREELDEVEKAAERASGLTRQLLAFSRKQILKPQVISLNDLVRDLGRILHRTVGEDIALDIDVDEHLGTVKADPGQLEQVLLNLVVNARDAMPRGGRLRIETRNVDAAVLRDYPEADADAYVALLVTDSGTGMPPSVLERVFEPFFTTKEQGKGTGLGLSTVYGSVKQSGGFVTVASEPGVGSTFGVYLPRVQLPVEVRPIEVREPSAIGAGIVLLVEDEPALRELASRILRRAGYEVLTAPNGDAAMEVAATFSGEIELLLTDVVMPGMSGRELAERLLALHPRLRLLYASGYTEDAIVTHGVSSQQTAFLAKPFAPSELLKKVREVLEQPVAA